jgi:hypothetical protein
LREQLAEAFEVIELDSDPGNPEGYGKAAHSVLTRELGDDPPNSAVKACARTVEFLREHLTA